MISHHLKIGTALVTLLCTPLGMSQSWASLMVEESISEESITVKNKNLSLVSVKVEDWNVTGIRVLSLISCDLDQEATSFLFSKLKKASNLISLNLSGSNIYNTIDALGKIPFLFSKGKGALWNASNLTQLNLSDNSLEGWCLKGIKDYLASHSNLKGLDLSGNKLDRFVLKEMAEGVEQSALEKLNLSCNNINWEGFRDLGYSLLQNPKLEYLDVSNNPLDDNAALSVRLLLNENSTLKFLGLAKVAFTPGGWEEVYRGLQEKKENGEAVNEEFFLKETWQALEALPEYKEKEISPPIPQKTLKSFEKEIQNIISASSSSDLIFDFSNRELGNDDIAEIVVAIGENTQSLKSLNINHNKDVNDEAVDYLIPLVARLKTPFRIHIEGTGISSKKLEEIETILTKKKEELSPSFIQIDSSAKAQAALSSFKEDLSKKDLSEKEYSDVLYKLIGFFHAQQENLKKYSSLSDAVKEVKASTEKTFSKYPENKGMAALLRQATESMNIF